MGRDTEKLERGEPLEEFEPSYVRIDWEEGEAFIIMDGSFVSEELVRIQEIIDEEFKNGN